MTDTPDVFIAIDLGASSGRTMLGRLHKGRLDLREADRFEHHARMQDGKLRWNWERIIASVREGLVAAAEQAGDDPISSVSCDSWAQDFGLLDGDGRLLYSPVSYRDGRTLGMPHSFADVIPPDALLRRVGSVAAPITTLCQLRAMAREEPEILLQSRVLLHVADLVHHDLCGAQVTDRTLATASQLRGIASGDWDRKLLAMLGIPDHLLPEVATDGAVIGRIVNAPHPRLRSCPVVVTAGHDTAAASAFLPTIHERAAFIMSGTWSMLGCAMDAPVAPESAAEDGLAILGLAMGRWGLFRPVMGLWIIQECRRQWARRGMALSFEEIAAAADAAGPQRALIDPDADCFLSPDDMPAEIARYCADTQQPVPQTPGEIARVVFASLAMDCRLGLETLQAATGTAFETLRMVGGGSANRTLCQLTADATELPVTAGPVEATALGNLLLQARAMGRLGVGEDIREVAARSLVLEHYEPERPRDEEAYVMFREARLSTLWRGR